MSKRGFQAVLLSLSLFGFAAFASTDKQASENNNISDDQGVVYKQPSHHRVHLGGISVGVGYMHGSPYWYPYGFSPFPYAYGLYPSMWGYPGWYDPLWPGFAYPGYYTGYPYSPTAGKVKLPTDDKLASVFIDGAFAGTANRLKTFYLEPGAYDIEVRQGDRVSASQRVYVLTGKTVHVRAGGAK